MGPSHVPTPHPLAHIEWAIVLHLHIECGHPLLSFFLRQLPTTRPSWWWQNSNLWAFVSEGSMRRKKWKSPRNARIGRHINHKVEGVPTEKAAVFWARVGGANRLKVSRGEG